MSSAARRAARVGTGLASVVAGASTACPSELSALATSSGSGWEALISGSLTTTAGRTSGASSGAPLAWRCHGVISAADSVVGIAATRRGGSAAASALATSMTLPPPSATSSSPDTAGRRSAASSSTRPGGTRCMAPARSATAGAWASARSVLSSA
jgi:hypothetical protein